MRTTVSLPTEMAQCVGAEASRSERHGGLLHEFEAGAGGEAEETGAEALRPALAARASYLESRSKAWAISWTVRLCREKTRKSLQASLCRRSLRSHPVSAQIPQLR
ncbi:MAG: hypothetical protein ACOZE5_10985 [Verrucomicrobiota bacterium]